MMMPGWVVAAFVLSVCMHYIHTVSSGAVSTSGRRAVGSGSD